MSRRTLTATAIVTAIAFLPGFGDEWMNNDRILCRISITLRLRQALVEESR
jgi:hypothetical protein